MDMASAILIIRLVAEGVGVAKELAALAKRVENGDKITDADIDAARAELDKAVAGWKDSVKKD